MHHLDLNFCVVLVYVSFADFHTSIPYFETPFPPPPPQKKKMSFKTTLVLWEGWEGGGVDAGMIGSTVRGKL